jgi:acylglycerol lipase
VPGFPPGGAFSVLVPDILVGAALSRDGRGGYDHACRRNGEGGEMTGPSGSGSGSSAGSGKGAPEAPTTNPGSATNPSAATSRSAATIATVAMEGHAVRAADETLLHHRHWQARGEPWATLLLVHGIAEHGGRYERTAARLAEAGLDVHAFDLRGHGLSGGRRVFVRRWDVFLDDLEREIEAVRDPGRPLVLMGHSMGSLISLTYATSDRPKPDLLVLSALPLGAAVPAWQKLAAPVLSRIAPHMVLANPIDGSQLSRDPAVAVAYFADPLVQPRTTTRLGAELFGAMKRGRRHLGDLHVPTLAIHGGDDRLVPTPLSEPIAAVPGVERRVLPDLRHESLNEPEGPQVVDQIVDWLRANVAAVSTAHPRG